MQPASANSLYKNRQQTVSGKFSLRSTSFYIAVIAGLCLLIADIEIINANPWLELKAMGQGLMSPHIVSYAELFNGLANTLSFALQGMAVAVVTGFLLALSYRHWWVKGFCAFIRAIHELFWALIFIQCFGLSPLTGLLTIALPYAGIPTQRDLLTKACH